MTLERGVKCIQIEDTVVNGRIERRIFSSEETNRSANDNKIITIMTRNKAKEKHCTRVSEAREQLGRYGDKEGMQEVNEMRQMNERGRRRGEKKKERRWRK